MTNGPVKRGKSHKILNGNTTQKWKNEQYKAEREYDFAEPGSRKEWMAKQKFKVATRHLKAKKK